MTTTTLSQEKLFAYIIVDDIHIDEEIKSKAKGGDGQSLSLIGDIYYRKKEYTKAMDWYLLGASKNNASSQYQIGTMYHYGQNVSVDYKLAMEWYLKAHNNGCIEATNNIGHLYQNGQGVVQNYKTALKWQLEVANKGEKHAQFNVGICYEYGDFVKADIQHALEWYEKSAQQGYQVAKDKIKYLDEQGYSIDYKQKDMTEQKMKIESLENKLRLSEQKRLEAEEKAKEKENEIKLLKQEIEGLKLELLTNITHLPSLKEDSVHQLEGSVSQIRINEDDPENDICFDE